MMYKLLFMNNEVFQTVYIGVCFLVLFSGFHTLSNLEKVFLDSTKKENPSYTGDGYTSLAVLYLVFSGFMWVVPSIISIIGAKLTLIIGSLGYSVLIASFLTECTWLLYVGSVCCGLGASMIWTSQGSYMVRVSSKSTITRNIALFSVLHQSAMIFGNVFAFIKFYGKDHLDRSTRTTVTWVLLGFSLAATVVMIFLPSPTKDVGKKNIENLGSPIKAIKKTMEVVTTRYMLILFVSFMYMGLQVCFMSGVLGACVGFTKLMDHSTQLVPAVGLIVGTGEIIAELSLIYIGKSITLWKWGHAVTMTFALLVEYLAFILIFLNFPNSSVLGDTFDTAFIYPSWIVAIIIAFLIGITDGIYMAMMPSMVGMLFPDNSVPAMAMYNFSYTLFTAVGFFYSNYIGLHWQLLVLTVTGTLGALCYIFVSLEAYSHNEETIEKTHN